MFDSVYVHQYTSLANKICWLSSARFSHYPDDQTTEDHVLNSGSLTLSHREPLAAQYYHPQVDEIASPHAQSNTPH